LIASACIFATDPLGDAALQFVLDLAARNGLTIYDPQGDTVTRPGTDN
jgi:hypothetical protein